MSARIASIELKRHEKVRANIDLPGVPAGTPGKVLVVSGVTWMRHRVLFDNGVEMGLLDGRHIVRRGDFIPVDERVEVEEVAVVETDGDAAGTAAEASVADNAFGVPAHLLERSKNARERLSAAS
ncbi:MAG: hypothetical protein WD691_03295 [Acidimicrobiales bacterium]